MSAVRHLFPVATPTPSVEDPHDTEAIVDKLDAEAMLDVAAFISARAARLPGDSRARRDLVDMSRNLSLAGRILWPAERPRVVESEA